MQAQQDVQLAGAVRNSPVQVPLAIEEPQATQASLNPTSHGNASGLMQEAAEAVQQVPHVDASANAHHDVCHNHTSSSVLVPKRFLTFTMDREIENDTT